MLDTVEITNEPTFVGQFKKWFILQNTSDTDMFIGFTDDAEDFLDVDNGFRLESNGGTYIHEKHSENIELRYPIFAVHASVGAKLLRVQGM